MSTYLVINVSSCRRSVELKILKNTESNSDITSLTLAGQFAFSFSHKNKTIHDGQEAQLEKSVSELEARSCIMRLNGHVKLKKTWTQNKAMHLHGEKNLASIA